MKYSGIRITLYKQSCSPPFMSANGGQTIKLFAHPTVNCVVQTFRSWLQNPDRQPLIKMRGVCHFQKKLSKIQISAGKRWKLLPTKMEFCIFWLVNARVTTKGSKQQ